MDRHELENDERELLENDERELLENDESCEELELDENELADRDYNDRPQEVDRATVAKVMERVNKDGTLRRIIRARKSDFVRNLIYLDGEKFSFAGRDYLRPVYDRQDRQILLKTSRQVEKTTFLANNLTADSVVINYNKSLYVSPSHTQTRQFSNEKLRPAIEKSPFIKRYYQDTRVSSQVFEKGFTNGSYIFLRSAFRSADRCLARGSRILLSDGNEVYIEDLLIGADVVSYDGETPVIRKVIGKQCNGQKECFRITMRTGQVLDASYDHRFLTSGGVKELRDIAAGDLIPVPVYSGESVDWVEVESVLPAGIQETWDIEIEGDPYYSANGIFTHNTRGISARNLCLDELQDFYSSEIPVIMECTSHFPDARVLMAGTPKSFDNPIEAYWKATTQNEWLVPCTSCRKWNFLDEQNIGPTEDYISRKLPPGPICKKCAKPINPSQGRWVSFTKDASIVGYRIPQLMVPWISGLYAQWLKLLFKRDTYPLGQFYNEVLGLSYDSSSKPVTREEIVACCQPYDLIMPHDLTSALAGDAMRFQLTAGIDWGEGNDGSEKSPSGKIRNASYTVLTIGGYVDQKTWKTFFIKKYQGKEVEPDFVVSDILRICAALGVVLIGADWGHGWGVNNALIRRYGASRVVQFQYLPKLKERLKWDPIGYKYLLARNFMMSELFYDIKHGFINFPRWSQLEPYAKDILAIYTEYNEYRREIKYDHRSSDPDDFFHSLHYARLASDIYHGKSRRYTLPSSTEG